MQDFQHYAEMVSAIITPIAAIVLSIYGWKKTGHIDLLKTLEHARDVLAIVVKGVGEGRSEDAAIEDAVNEVARLRGHRLSEKLRRKLAARLRAMVEEAGKGDA